MRKDIFWSAVALMGFLVCTYIYCVTTTIRNIVTERNLSIQISDINENLSTKEFNVIDLENNVTLSYAESLGFTDPKEKIFITPTSVSYVYSNSTSNTI